VVGWGISFQLKSHLDLLDSRCYLQGTSSRRFLVESAVTRDYKLYLVQVCAGAAGWATVCEADQDDRSAAANACLSSIDPSELG
jgi:hypothetical protein